MPLVLFMLLATVLGTTSIDVRIAQTLFFDAAHGRWVGADSWWINEFLHTGGRWAIRAIVLAGVGLCIAADWDHRLRPLRRPLAYCVVAMVLSIGLVGALKTVTNVDCPWDLDVFGGRYPFVPLFVDRAGALPQGYCFPAAHAGSGYALLALYFGLRERSAALARLCLGLGLATGLVFGLAQQARGAHFLSHDVWSAFITWMIALTLYAFAFKSRLWGPGVRSSEQEQGILPDETPAATHRLVVDQPFGVPCRAGRLRGPGGG